MRIIGTDVKAISKEIERLINLCRCFLVFFLLPFLSAAIRFFKTRFQHSALPGGCSTAESSSRGEICDRRQDFVTSDSRIRPDARQLQQLYRYIYNNYINYDSVYSIALLSI